jgi:signal transduction histidine kinase/CheY-like chemotaxis protein/HAMP domain-containing protein
MKLKDFKISVQLFLGFGAMFLFIISLGLVSYLQSEKLHQQTEIMYNHPMKVRQAISNLNKDILIMSVGIRDILLNANENQKLEIAEEMETSSVDAKHQFEVLRSQYLGPQKDVEEAYKAYLNWNVAYSQYQKLIDAGQIEEAKNSLRTKESIGILRNTMIKEIEDVNEFAKTKTESIYKNSQNINRSLNTQLVAIVVSVLLLMFLISYVLIRNIRNPIIDLSKATKRFRDGDLSVRSRIDSRNEFGEMSDSFNSMVQSIQTTTELKEKMAALSELMLTQEDPKKFFISLLPDLAKYTNSQMAAVYLLSDDKKKYEHFHSFGMENQAKQSFIADNFEGEFGAVLSTRKIQTINKIPKDTQFIFHTVSGKLVPREIITIPIQSGKEVIAIISLASIRSYTPQSELLIHNIQNTLSARIEGVIAYSKLQNLAKKLEIQNHELEVQKTELSSQSMELKEQNHELEIQKIQLHEANMLKTNFLSNMSHELRTPLNSVIALSGVLNRRLVNKIGTDEYSYLEVIERNGKHLLSLINDILDIARIESGREEVEISKFSTNDLISELVNMIEPQARQKNLELIINKNNENILIASDISKCRHILLNLIGNAVKFTDKGKVEIDVVRKAEKIKIMVTDTGIGISESHLDHIFDEFRQADSSTSRRFGGTGLGLAIAKKYANFLGGTISVQSVLEKGSTFTLTLPLKYSEEVKPVEKVNNILEFQSQNQQIPRNLSATKTILLVDDSEPAIIQMKDFMQESGYTILTAKNGFDALEVISNTIPDAMILDLMMPGVDGFSVLESLRNANETASVPVLILTAKQITKEDLNFLKRNNVHQLIQKGDVNRIELLNAVSNLFYKNEIVEVPQKKEDRKIIGTPTVLIVEDNVDNMTTVKAIIGDKFNILEATDGKEAVALSIKHIPHLILMDISLPGIDGIQAFKQIRQNGKSEHIPIVALTASAMTSDRETILAHGFDAYIAKPIDVNDFFNTIDKVLYGK